MGRSLSKPSGPKRTNIRCAIYTRKSSEEGLDQAFNSLDAQREACEAYIASQKQEGWVALPALYDDGGISGATMARPALTRLLADIDAHRVDTVVVYKVDRLTRSLGDFAKIVEIFDRHEVSFVSVTQQFNTTSSMGRLTLNMLLSFAQFEREVTAERIRDKIAASKKKGMWMGGVVPLGYDVKDRKLVVNKTEAETLRHIHERYAELGSVRALQEALDREGIVSKRRTNRYGRCSGGKRFTRGALYLLLQNRLYRGEIVHKEQIYPGLHEAIIDEALWQKVQDTLAGNRIKQAGDTGVAEPSLLKGLIYDADGQVMTPTHAVKGGRRYRYYVSNRLITPESGPDADAASTKNRSGQRIPAISIEPLVIEHLRQFLLDPSALLDGCRLENDTAGAQENMLDAAKRLAGQLEAPDSDCREPIQKLIARVQILAGQVIVTLDRGELLSALGASPGDDTTDSTKTENPPVILTINARLSRTGVGMRMVLTDGTEPNKPDPALIRLVSQAFAVRHRLLDNTALTLREIASEEGLGDSYITRLMRLSWLAPEIVMAILSGAQPPELTARRLRDYTNLPIDWAEQKTALGFS